MHISTNEFHIKSLMFSLLNHYFKKISYEEFYKVQEYIWIIWVSICKMVHDDSMNWYKQNKSGKMKELCVKIKQKANWRIFAFLLCTHWFFFLSTKRKYCQFKRKLFIYLIKVIKIIILWKHVLFVLNHIF